MMKKIFICIFLILTTVECQSGTHAFESKNQSNVKSDLLILPGAIEVNSEAHGDDQALRYRLKVAFPADNVIQTLSKHFSSLGYCPLKNNWYNRDQKSNFVCGWVQHIGLKENTWGLLIKGHYCYFYSEWWSHWINKSGDLIDCHLMYLSPSKIETNTNDLDLQFMKITKKRAEIIEKDIISNSTQEQKDLILLSPETKPNSSLDPNPIISSDCEFN